MTKVKTKLFQILLKNSQFCNLCYEDIESLEKSYYIDDELTLENETKVLGDLMCSVLGLEMSFCVSGIICEACTRHLISLYNFIITCKQNTFNLYNSIASLEGCLLDAVANANVFHTLFISLNLEDYSCKQYYDCKTSSNNTTEAFIHFQEILATEQTKTEAQEDIGVNDGLFVVKDDLFDAGDQNYEEFNITVNNDELNEAIFNEESNEAVNTGLPKNKKKQTKIKNVKKDTHKRKKKIHIATKDMLLDENYGSVIKCKLCLKIFPKLQNLRQHYIQVHAPKTFNCTKCVSSFGSASFLESHMSSVHKPSVCPECGKVYSCRSTLYVHIQSHRTKHSCELCGKEFKYKSNLKQHINMKKCDDTYKRCLKRNYICDYCSKAFSYKSGLRTHIRYQHGFVKGHKCLWCNKTFPAVSKLKLHSVVHTKEKNFHCDICSQSFVTKHSLLFHTRLHNGERPYSCEYCDLRFLSSSRRITHVNQNHLPPKYVCDICQKKFTVKTCLTRHRKLHFDPKSRLHVAGATAPNE